MPDEDDQTQDPATDRAPTSGDEGNRVEELQTPSPAGGPGVSPGGTSEGRSDTSVFGQDDSVEARTERLQHADEDTFPPSA